MTRILSFLLLMITHNLTFGQNKIYDRLIYQLQMIEHDDQGPRILSDSIRKQYKYDSVKGMVQLTLNWQVTRRNDSINLIKVESMIDKYGWIGPEEIGDDGCQTLFIVIQHADLKTQEKYLPVMRAAVKAGKARQGSLAFLEDRVLLRKGQKQMYGTQVFLNMVTKETYVLPLEDPFNLDIRRASAGLQTMSNYLKDNFNMRWDVTQYFIDLPIADSLLRASHFMR